MKKLKAKHAKICTAVLIVGLVVMCAGCLIIPDSLFAWKIGCIILGTAVSMGALLSAVLLFRCPHCGKSKASPLWFREYHCPCCGKKIQWQ